MKNELPPTASAAEIGKLLGRSDRRVRQIAADAGIAASEHGLWPVGPVIRAAVAAASRERDSDAEKEARARLMAARAREVELRTAERERELVPTEDAVGLVIRYIGSMVAKLNGLPAQITRDVKLRRQIEAVIDGFRNEMDKELAEVAKFYAGEPGENADA